jgi:hypothetical protein
VEGHGLTPRELELMLNMEAQPLPTEGDDSDVGRTIPVYTANPQPSTLNPQPSTLNLKP